MLNKRDNSYEALLLEEKREKKHINKITRIISDRNKAVQEMKWSDLTGGCRGRVMVGTDTLEVGSKLRSE